MAPQANRFSFTPCLQPAPKAPWHGTQLRQLSDMFIALLPLKKYSDFQGRAGRREFWSFFALSAAVLVAVGVLTGLNIDPLHAGKAGETTPTWALAYLFWWVVTAIPWFAVQVRRLHDQGRGTWMISLSVAGYVALFATPPLGMVLLVLFFSLMALPGEPKANRFGAIPGDVQLAADERADATNRQVDRSGGSKHTHTTPQNIAASPHENRYSEGREICEAQSPAHSFPQNGPGDSGGNQAQPILGSLAAPLEPHPASPTGELVAAPTEPPAIQDDDLFTITKTARGYFTYGGYGFATEAQAQAYADQISRQAAHFRGSLAARSAPTSPDHRDETATGSSAGERSATPEPGTVDHREGSPEPSASVAAEAEPAAAPPAEPAAQPVDKYTVTPTADGRFMSGGYSFTTQAQAEGYANRRRSAADRGLSPTAAPAEHHETPKPDDGPAERWMEVEPGIKIGRDGRFYVRGYAFATLPEARVAAGRSTPAKPVPAAKPTGIFAKLFQPRPAAPTARWIAEPTMLDAGGFSFEGYLLYFGKPPRDRWDAAHRALIDPTLPVARNADTLGSTLGYWPDFSQIAQNARRAYLEWLAGGRSDPRTPIGYVFIYFYGLERRLIQERSRSEAPAILAEAKRLLGIYGHNPSFRNYCTTLIEAGELLAGLMGEERDASLELRHGYEIPIGVRVRIGRKVRDGLPINADDALSWTLGHPQLYPRTPVSRCFDEFTALWRHEFAARFPEGIKVKSPKARLQLHYRAASAEFIAQIALDDLPDIGAISGPVAKFEALLGECTDALAPLSRHLGRKPDDRNSLFAVALCPAPALSTDSKRLLAAARDDLFADQDGDGVAQASLRQVLGILTGTQGALPSDQRASTLKRLPETLDAMGVGFEPDKRHAPAATLTDDTMLCLFDAGETAGSATDSEAYRAARTMVEIAVLAAMADTLVVEPEFQAIARDLAQISGLHEADRRRLQAHARAMAANPPKLRAVTKRMVELSEAEKDRMVDAAVNAILADQRVLPAEVRFLEGLYKALGKPQDEIYSRLHTRTAAPASPGAASTRAAGKIDDEKLQRLRAETTAVSSMLSEIFREEDASPPPTESTKTDLPERALPGLDAAHSSVLFALIEEPIEIDAFAELCRAQRLLPEGAVETINDWGFDALGDVAIEHDDLVCVQPHLIDNIRNLAAA